MSRYLAWIGKIMGMAWVGPGSVVLGDSGLRADPGFARAPGWVGRAAATAPVAVLSSMEVDALLGWAFVVSFVAGSVASGVAAREIRRTS